VILEAVAIGSLLASLGASRTLVDSALGRPLVRVVHFPSNPWPMEARAWETPEGLEFLTALAVMISNPKQEGILLSVTPNYLVLIFRSDRPGLYKREPPYLAQLVMKVIPLHPVHSRLHKPIEGIPADQQLAADMLLLTVAKRSEIRTDLLLGEIFVAHWRDNATESPLFREAVKFEELTQQYFPNTDSIIAEVTRKESLRDAIAEISEFSIGNIQRNDLHHLQIMSGKILPTDLDFALITLQQMASRDIPITEDTFMKLYASGSLNSLFGVMDAKQDHLNRGGPLFPLGHPLRESDLEP